MNTEFVENVKKWATLEKHLKLLNEKTREIRSQKNDLGDSICEYMEKMGTPHKPIELSDGVIKITEKREYSPLTFSYIEECLDAIISDKSHVDLIMDYLHEHREITIVNELKRTYHKSIDGK